MTVFSNQGSEGKRIKLLIVTLETLGDIFKFDGSHIPVFGGIPEDAKVVGMEVNQNIPALVLRYEHESFPLIPDSTLITQTIMLQCGKVIPCGLCLGRVVGLKGMFSG